MPCIITHHLHYLTKSSYISLLKNNPYIDSVFQIENSINEVIADLKQEEYDYVIDLHNNLRTQILKFKLGVPSRSFNKLNMEKFMLTKCFNFSPPWTRMKENDIQNRQTPKTVNISYSIGN